MILLLFFVDIQLLRRLLLADMKRVTIEAISDDVKVLIHKSFLYQKFYCPITEGCCPTIIGSDVEIRKNDELGIVIRELHSVNDYWTLSHLAVSKLYFLTIFAGLPATTQ